MGIFSRLFPRKQAQNPEPVKPNTMTVPKAAPQPIPPEPERPDAKVATYKVAGVTHYQDNILSLASKNPEYTLGKRDLINEGLVDERVYEYDFYPIKAELVPEPDNPVDPKAIKVLVDGLHVGYIKAGSCSHLLRVIRENRIQKIDVTVGGGRYKYLECTDYTESGKEIYTFDRGDIPLYVHLSITELQTKERPKA